MSGDGGPVFGGARVRPLPPLVKCAIGLIVAAGIALRVSLYMERQSLRLDEARLVLNIASRSYWQLLSPLDHAQSAPVLFLWAERAAIQLAGVNEFALRLVPLLAGACALMLLPVVARRLAGNGAAVLATGLAAGSPVLLTYSNEAKQYIVEALATVLLVWLAMRWLDGLASPGRRWSLLIGGAVSVWVAAPAVFVLVGVLTAGLAAVRERRPQLRRDCLVALGLWGGVFLLAYAGVYRSASQNPYLTHFWRPSFLIPAASGFPDRSYSFFREVLWGFMAHPFDAHGTLSTWFVPATMLVLLGLAYTGGREVLRTRGLPEMLLCLAPIVAGAAASMLGLYPFSLRLMLFAAPVFYVLLSAGVVALAGRFSGRLSAWSAAALGVVLLVPQTRLSLFLVTGELATAPMRQMVAELRIHRLPGDAVYVFARSIPEWTYYTTDWSRPDTARLDWLGRQSQPGGPAFENAPARGRPVADREGEDLLRVWLDGVEVLGLPSGAEFQAGDVRDTAVPDAGWAAREAERIRSAAKPGAWIVMSTFNPHEAAILDEVARRGGKATYSHVGRNVALVRVEFSPAAGSPSGAGKEGGCNAEGCSL